MFWCFHTNLSHVLRCYNFQSTLIQNLSFTCALFSRVMYNTLHLHKERESNGHQEYFTESNSNNTKLKSRQHNNVTWNLCAKSTHFTMVQHTSVLTNSQSLCSMQTAGQEFLFGNDSIGAYSQSRHAWTNVGRIRYLLQFPPRSFLRNKGSTPTIFFVFWTQRLTARFTQYFVIYR